MPPVTFLKKYHPVIYFEVNSDYRDQSRETCHLLKSFGYNLSFDIDELNRSKSVRDVLAY